MSQFLLILIIAVVVGGIVFGVATLLTGSDPGMVDVDPHVRSVPLPDDRSLEESDLVQLKFDTGLRGYRADQVDEAIDRLGVDLSQKTERIGLLESEISALREGRIVEANQFKQKRDQLQKTQFEQMREQKLHAEMDQTQEQKRVEKTESPEMSDPRANVEE